MKQKNFIILLVFICLFSVSGYSQYSRSIHKTFDLKSDGLVFIDTYKGSIIIKTWNKDKVDVQAKIEADDRDEHSEKKVKYTEINFDFSRSSLKIKSDYRKIKNKSSSFFKLFSGDTGSLPLVHYTIKMPRTADLKIKDYKSETEISNLHSSIDLETYKGSVEIRSFTGDIALETYKGEATIRFDKMTDHSTFDTYKGDIEITLPHKTGFDIDLDFGRKVSFRSDFEIPYQPRGKKDYHYRDEVNGGGNTLKIESYKGDIRIYAK